MPIFLYIFLSYFIVVCFPISKNPDSTSYSSIRLPSNYSVVSPKVGISIDGSFVILWRSVNLYFQVFDSQGNHISERISVPNSIHCIDHTITSKFQDQFVIALITNDSLYINISSYGLYNQKIIKNFVFVVKNKNTERFDSISITDYTSSKYVMLFVLMRIDTYYIYTSYFDSELKRIKPNLYIDYANNVINPTVKILNNGLYIITWSENLYVVGYILDFFDNLIFIDTKKYFIFGFKDEFSNSDNIFPSIAFGSSTGDFIVAWQSSSLKELICRRKFIFNKKSYKYNMEIDPIKYSNYILVNRLGYFSGDIISGDIDDSYIMVWRVIRGKESFVQAQIFDKNGEKSNQNFIALDGSNQFQEIGIVMQSNNRIVIAASSFELKGTISYDYLLIKVFQNYDYYFTGQFISKGFIVSHNVSILNTIYSLNNNYMIVVYDSDANIFKFYKFNQQNNILFNDLTYSPNNKNSTVLKFEVSFYFDESFVIIWQTKNNIFGCLYNVTNNIFEKEFLVLNTTNLDFKVCFITGAIVLAWNSSISSITISLLWLDLKGKIIKPEYKIMLYQQNLFDKDSIIINSILGLGFKVLSLTDPPLDLTINLNTINIFDPNSTNPQYFDVIFTNLGQIKAFNWNLTYLQCVETSTDKSSECEIRYPNGIPGRKIALNMGNQLINFAMGIDESFLASWYEDNKYIIWNKIDKIENSLIKQEKIVMLKHIAAKGKQVSGIDSIFSDDGNTIWTLDLNEFNYGVLFINEFIEKSRTFYFIKKIDLKILNPNKLNIFGNFIYVSNSSLFIVFVDILKKELLSNNVNFNSTKTFFYFYENYCFFYIKPDLFIYSLDLYLPYNLKMYKSIKIQNNYKISRMKIVNNKCYFLMGNFLIYFNKENLFVNNTFLNNFNLELISNTYNTICIETIYNIDCLYKYIHNNDFEVDSSNTYIFFGTDYGLDIVNLNIFKNTKNLGFGSKIKITSIAISNDYNYLAICSELSVFIINIENPLNSYLVEEINYNFIPKKVIFSKSNNYLFVNGVYSEILLFLKVDLKNVHPSLNLIDKIILSNYSSNLYKNINALSSTVRYDFHYFVDLSITYYNDIKLVYKIKKDKYTLSFVKINLDFPYEVPKRGFFDSYFFTNSYLYIYLHIADKYQLDLYLINEMKNNTLTIFKTFQVLNSSSFVTDGDNLYFFIKNKGVDIYNYDNLTKSIINKKQINLPINNLDVTPFKMIISKDNYYLFVVHLRTKYIDQYYSYFIVTVLNITSIEKADECFISEFQIIPYNENKKKFEYIVINDNSYFLVLDITLKIYQIFLKEKRISIKTDFFSKIPLKIDTFLILNSDYLMIETLIENSDSLFTIIFINNFDYPLIVDQKYFPPYQRLSQSLVINDNNNIYFLNEYDELFGFYENEIDIMFDINSINLGQQKQFTVSIIPINLQARSRTLKKVKIRKISLEFAQPTWVSLNLIEKSIVITPPNAESLYQFLNQQIYIEFSLPVDIQHFTKNEYYELQVQGYIDVDGFLTNKLFYSNSLLAKLPSYTFKKILILRYDSFIKINNEPKIKTSLNDQLNKNINNNFSTNIIKVGHPFVFQISLDSIEDKDNDYLSFTTSFLPVWMNFDSILLIFKGTPSKEEKGLYEINLTISDDYSNYTEKISFEVKAFGPKLLFPLKDQLETISNYNPEIDKISYLSFDSRTFVDENSGNFDTLTYSLSLLNNDSVPIWMKIDSKFPTFSFSPTIYELYNKYSIKLICYNDIGESSYDIFEIEVLPSWLLILKYIGSILSGILFVIGLIKYRSLIYQIFCKKHYSYIIPIKTSISSYFHYDIFLIAKELEISRKIWLYILNKEKGNKTKNNWNEWISEKKKINDAIDDAIKKLSMQNLISSTDLEENGIIISIIESFVARKALKTNFSLNKIFEKMKKDLQKKDLKSWIEPFIEIEEIELSGNRATKFPKIIVKKLKVDEIMRKKSLELIKSESSILRKIFCCCCRKVKPIDYDEIYFKTIYEIIKAEALGIPENVPKYFYFLESTRGMSIFVSFDQIGLVTSFRKRKLGNSMLDKFKILIGLDIFRIKVKHLPEWMNLELGSNYLKLSGTVPIIEGNGEIIGIQFFNQLGLLLRQFLIKIDQIDNRNIMNSGLKMEDKKNSYENLKNNDVELTLIKTKETINSFEKIENKTVVKMETQENFIENQISERK